MIKNLSPKLILANAVVMANATLAHMRKVAYTLIFIDHSPSATTRREMLEAAEAKRIRKMEKRKPK